MRNARDIFGRFAPQVFRAALALMLLAAGAAPAAAADATAITPGIAAAFSNPDRFAGDSGEDARRKAAEVLAFMGADTGQHVLDFFAGGGYNSELLSRIVGPSGSVIAYHSPAGAARSGEKLAKRFGGGRLANVKQIVASANELKLDAGSLDGVLFVMAYHDLYHAPKDAATPANNIAQINAGLFQALKPGGVIVVVDHIANADADPAKAVEALHRIDPQVVQADFIKAGFTLDSESKVLSNNADDHTRPVFDPAVRYRTDRFILRFRKPK